MQTATSGLAGSIQRLNALASDALTQYHAEIQAGGEPIYPAWVDDLAAVADALVRKEEQEPTLPVRLRGTGGSDNNGDGGAHHA